MWQGFSAGGNVVLLLMRTAINAVNCRFFFEFTRAGWVSTKNTMRLDSGHQSSQRSQNASVRKFLMQWSKIVSDHLQAAFENPGGLVASSMRNQREVEQLRNRTKWLAFLIFGLSTFTDALLTVHLLRLEGIAEANPIMVFAMRELPGGMFSVKAAVLVALVLFWRRCTDSFLLLIAFGMTAISFWNSLLVAFSF